MPKVTAIVVTYNSATTVKRCLRSLYEQVINLEVVVVDNNSVDRTTTMVKELLKPTDKLIINNRNLGFAAGVNVGIKQATGDYLFLFNPDAYLPPDALVKAIQSLDSHPMTGAVGLRLVGLDGLPQGSFGHFPTWKRELRQILGIAKYYGQGRYPEFKAEPQEFTAGFKEWVGAGALLGSASLFHKVGFFDERYFLYLEDVDWCRRLKEAGYGCWYETSVSATHLGQGSSVSKEDRQSARREEIKSMIYYYKKWGVKGRWLLNLLLQIKLRLYA